MIQAKTKVSACLYCGSRDLTHITNRSDAEGVVKCSRCGLMMVEHLSKNTEKLYTADYFKNMDAGNGYTNYLSLPVANIIGKYAFTRLFAKPGVHVDLGCADGSLMEIFAGEGFATHGLEISKAAATVAQAKGLDVKVTDLTTFPAGLPKADVVTAFDLLEHVENLGAVLKQVKNNLQNNGYLVFSTLSVQKEEPSDYWFNNSLEHYIYFNKDNLAYILGEVFGKGNFAFVETQVNGVAELWGVAKKGSLGQEREVIAQIESGSFDKKDSEAGYMLGLFYNQISRFALSQKIIAQFKSKWPAATFVQATFYNYYLHGKFQKAVAIATPNKPLIPATDSVFWQALADAEDRLHGSQRNDTAAAKAESMQLQEELARLHKEVAAYTAQVAALKKETGRYTSQISDLNEEANRHNTHTAVLNKEIIDLRTQAFRLMDEIQALRNSRVVGRVIKLRDRIGDSIPKIKRAPGKAAYKARKAVAKITPAPIRLNTMKFLRHVKRTAKSQLEEYRQRAVEVQVVSNKLHAKNAPLVSVVIPYYNQVATADETIQSLQTQTFKGFEIIIVDDGSTDPDSIQKLEDFKKDGLQATILRQRNQGVASARNAGVRQAKGRYVICLDSDDMLYPDFIEKAVLVLETTPDIAVVTSYMDSFGVINEKYKHAPYDPMDLYRDNMVITAAAFRKEAWSASGGYKSDIGYEDWDYWLSLSEHGFWGKTIPEALFRYRISMKSRYVEDKGVHWNNLKKIHALHPNYKSNIKRLLAKRQHLKHVIKPQTAFVNLDDKKDFYNDDNSNANILITIPWMTFGGAETLIYNFCREINDIFNISFVTGLKSEHEWEHKFKEISPNIYHLANLFEDEKLYIEFISNYIKTRNIDILHIIHNGFTFDMLPELKKRHPKLKIAVTVFNDRVPYLDQAVDREEYIDAFTADNEAVAKHFDKDLKHRTATVIPNGINCYDEFNPTLFDRPNQRAELQVDEKDLAVFFVGRLSEEKNPDVFLRAAKNVLGANKRQGNVKFFLIGDGPMQAAIKKTLRTMSSRNVKYLGYQPSSEVARYLSAADIFVLPSAIEGFPLSILEAMAMQVAVVASDVGAVSDIIESGKEGFVVAPGSAKEITAAITALQKDPELLEDFKKKAREKVKKKYSNLSLGGNYKKLYDSLLN